MQPGLGCLRRGPVGVVSEVQEGMARSQRRGYSWGFRVFQLHIFNLRGGGSIRSRWLRREMRVRTIVRTGGSPAAWRVGLSVRGRGRAVRLTAQLTNRTGARRSGHGPSPRMQSPSTFKQGGSFLHLTLSRVYVPPAISS